MRTFLIFTLVFIASGFLAPDTASAQGIFGGVCSGETCSACHIAVIANTLISWLIGVVMVLFAVLIVWAGFGLVTSGGNPSALTDAKSRFTNAFIGLIIVLSAWLIVDTLMRGLVGSNGEIRGYGPWSEIKCSQQTEAGTDSGSLDVQAVMDFTGDHGYGVDGVTIQSGPAGMPVPITSGGGNCPGASDSQVVSVPGEGSHRLLPSASQSYVAMRAAAAADGISLNLSSSYRSQATQEEIWTRKGCDTAADQCRGRVGRPCSKGGNGSNHNSGVAIDISGSVCGSAKFNWLKANGGRFGFYNNLTCSDPYHWSPSGR